MNTQASDKFELLVAPPSTWALRAWLTLKLADIDFSTKAISHDSLMDKGFMREHSDTGLVPVLTHRGAQIHDSLAISEYANDLKPEAGLYPSDQIQRAQARSLVAEMHSGFVGIREQMPFFIGEQKQGSRTDGVEKDIKRLYQCWEKAESPFYFGTAGIIDAFYAVMAARLFRYSIQLDGDAGIYQSALLQWPLLQQGLKEQTRW